MVCVCVEVLSCPGWESSVVDIVFQIRNLAWWHIPVTALGGWGRRIISLWPACCTIMFCLHKKIKKKEKKKKLYLGHLGFLTRTDVAVCGCAPVMDVSLAWWSFTYVFKTNVYWTQNSSSSTPSGFTLVKFLSAFSGSGVNRNDVERNSISPFSGS